MDGERHASSPSASACLAGAWEPKDLCWSRCAEEYGNPCTRMCPANVYEMVDDEEHLGRKQLHLNTNCVHCKTCDLIDPYLNIRWVVPEGGDGPNYSML